MNVLARFFKRHPFVLVPFVFYALTCSPTVGSGAPAMHIDSAMRGVISTHVDSHNIMLMTGWLFKYLPIPELAARMNLVSAFYGALAVVGLYFALLCLSRGRGDRRGDGRWESAWGASLLMVSHSVWWHSTIFESYAINAAFTTWALYLMLEFEYSSRIGFLYAASFLAGLSVFNHISMGMLCVGVGIGGLSFIARQPRPVMLTLKSLGFALAGLSPWMGVLIRDCSRLGLGNGLNEAFDLGHEPLTPNEPTLDLVQALDDVEVVGV